MHRIRFANQLRGIAALAVACSHLIGVFWAIPEAVTAATFSPPQAGPLPGLFWIANLAWFQLGPFGVALFFLISGLVIPFSLEKHSRLSFVLARLLRIYPTYIAALLLEMLVLYGAAQAWGRPFGYGGWTITANALLVYDLIGQPSIDLVNWTLSVELKFYLLVVLLAGPIRRGNAAALIGAALGILAANAALAWFGWLDAVPSTPAYTFSSHSLCLIYMLMGTLFNFHLRGKIGTGLLWGGVGLLLLVFAVTWRTTVWRAQFPAVTVNYAYALLLFAGLYAVRHSIPRNPVLDVLAAISFPFYVLHSLLGYSVLRAGMVGLGWGYYPALLVTVAVILAASALLHWVVERPTIRAGRWLAPANGRAASPLVHSGVTISATKPASGAVGGA